MALRKMPGDSHILQSDFCGSACTEFGQGIQKGQKIVSSPQVGLGSRGPRAPAGPRPRSVQSYRLCRAQAHVLWENRLACVHSAFAGTRTVNALCESWRPWPRCACPPLSTSKPMLPPAP